MAHSFCPAAAVRSREQAALARVVALAAADCGRPPAPGVALSSKPKAVHQRQRIQTDAGCSYPGLLAGGQRIYPPKRKRGGTAPPGKEDLLPSPPAEVRAGACPVPRGLS